MTDHLCQHCICEFGWEWDGPAPEYCPDCVRFRDECRRDAEVDRRLDEQREGVERL